MIRQSDIMRDAKIWVEKLSIATDNPNNNASTLSGGNQQKLFYQSGLVMILIYLY